MKFRKWLESFGSSDCVGKVYYWLASGGMSNRSEILPTGFPVPPWKPKMTQKHLELEKMFEEVRMRKYSDRPSRINPPCKFLAADVQSAKHWAHEFQPVFGAAMREAAPIYMVCCQGPAFEADGHILTKITGWMDWNASINNTSFRSKVYDLADRYWSGAGAESSGMVLPEILTNAEVYVMSKVNTDLMPFRVGDFVSKVGDPDSEYEVTGMIDRETPYYLKGKDGMANIGNANQYRMKRSGSPPTAPAPQQVQRVISKKSGRTGKIVSIGFSPEILKVIWDDDPSTEQIVMKSALKFA
jgi:hypothetical protein